MAKKLFLNRQKAFPSSEVPSVREEQTELEARSPDRSSTEVETVDELPFTVLDETVKSLEKFNATGRSLLIKFNSPGEHQNPNEYLKECITKLTNYLVEEIPGRDFVGLKICNTENLSHKVVGVSFRRCDQLKSDVVWGILGKIVQSNARFGLTDQLKVRLDHVKMPVGNGGVKTKGQE